METLHISAGSKKYPVYIGIGAVNQLKSFLQENYPKLTSVLIITDETVGKLYLEEFKAAVNLSETYVKVVPAGEKAKTFEVYHECLSYALEKKLDRKSLILSFGGGAVGDLAGFVAASYMRGIPFIQIPTTILAHDSAVGGKVAINHALGKNMIGAFYQPEAVFYDLKFLQSLPLAEIRSGFAEVIKHALISDEEFYDWLVKSVENLNSIPNTLMTEFLTKGIKVKGGIVEQDETETGVRAYLNFGHTLGHAIEAEAGYGSISHGEAVAIGMVFALKISMERHSFNFNLLEFNEWLKKLGYVTELPEGLSTHRLLARMKQDKKSVGQKVRFVLLNKIGSPGVEELDDAYLLNRLDAFKRQGGIA
ncbi:3-dehydroquinate synthase [Mesobacillus foraminis]|uniref:3-dehydroquinate synthase n=1 Tax=Mesobacillus foraminis TaxID=279826 RepID=UPI0039A0B478